LSTVRIYKVAELLNTTSQEVLALLKKAHGIELKSASSTLEEIVARQFVDRLAKQRNITLPKGDIFSEQAAQAVKTAAKSKKGGAAPEPAKPAAPTKGGEVLRGVDPGGSVNFAGTAYRVGNRFIGQTAGVRIVGDTVQITVDGALMRTHRARHDKSKEFGALAQPNGKPRRNRDGVA